jgi:hypothetical protein
MAPPVVPNRHGHFSSGVLAQRSSEVVEAATNGTSAATCTTSEVAMKKPAALLKNTAKKSASAVPVIKIPLTKPPVARKRGRPAGRGSHDHSGGLSRQTSREGIDSDATESVGDLPIGSLDSFIPAPTDFEGSNNPFSGPRNAAEVIPEPPTKGLLILQTDRRKQSTTAANRQAAVPSCHVDVNPGLARMARGERFNVGARRLNPEGGGVQFLVEWEHPGPLSPPLCDLSPRPALISPAKKENGATGIESLPPKPDVPSTNINSPSYTTLKDHIMSKKASLQSAAEEGRKPECGALVTGVCRIKITSSASLNKLRDSCVKAIKKSQHMDETESPQSQPEKTKDDSGNIVDEDGKPPEIRAKEPKTVNKDLGLREDGKADEANVVSEKADIRAFANEKTDSQPKDEQSRLVTINKPNEGGIGRPCQPSTKEEDTSSGKPDKLIKATCREGHTAEKSAIERKIDRPSQTDDVSRVKVNHQDGPPSEAKSCVKYPSTSESKESTKLSQHEQVSSSAKKEITEEVVPSAGEEKAIQPFSVFKFYSLPALQYHPSPKPPPSDSPPHPSKQEDLEEPRSSHALADDKANANSKDDSEEKLAVESTKAKGTLEEKEAQTKEMSTVKGEVSSALREEALNITQASNEEAEVKEPHATQAPEKKPSVVDEAEKPGERSEENTEQGPKCIERAETPTAETNFMEPTKKGDCQEERQPYVEAEGMSSNKSAEVTAKETPRPCDASSNDEASCNAVQTPESSTRDDIAIASTPVKLSGKTIVEEKHHAQYSKESTPLANHESERLEKDVVKDAEGSNSLALNKEDLTDALDNSISRREEPVIKVMAHNEGTKAKKDEEHSVDSLNEVSQDSAEAKCVDEVVPEGLDTYTKDKNEPQNPSKEIRNQEKQEVTENSIESAANDGVSTAAEASLKVDSEMLISVSGSDQKGTSTSVEPNPGKESPNSGDCSTSAIRESKHHNESSAVAKFCYKGTHTADNRVQTSDRSSAGNQQPVHAVKVAASTLGKSSPVVVIPVKCTPNSVDAETNGCSGKTTDRHLLLSALQRSHIADDPLLTSKKPVIVIYRSAPKRKAMPATVEEGRERLQPKKPLLPDRE